MALKAWNVICRAVGLGPLAKTVSPFMLLKKDSETLQVLSEKKDVNAPSLFSNQLLGDETTLYGLLMWKRWQCREIRKWVALFANCYNL